MTPEDTFIIFVSVMDYSRLYLAEVEALVISRRELKTSFVEHLVWKANVKIINQPLHGSTKSKLQLA
jgi:hypothetical protein